MPGQPGREQPDAGQRPRRAPSECGIPARSGTCPCADRGYSSQSRPPSGTCRSETRLPGRSSRSPRAPPWSRVAPIRPHSRAIIEVVLGLEALIKRQAHARAYIESLLEPRGSVVRGPDRADLSGPSYVGIGAERLFERCVRVIFMRLVQVDVVGLQPLEGGLD